MKFTEEEIRENVIVPASVEMELIRLVEEKLNQCGVFYRVYSRIKKASSLERKYNDKEYDNDKKIQDLIGLRINLYFKDDSDIVKDIMENLFALDGEWVEKQVDTTSFEPIKLNGVFRLPEYLCTKISPATWNMAIDKTFEIQLKTMFFEGWHEVEHDMRYKNKQLWSRYESYSRRFNSIVATLELCDNAMIDLLEDFAYKLYKNSDWEGMLRMHFRIRLSEQKLYDELIPVLADNEKRIGKALFKFSRRQLIEMLSGFYRDIPISVNMIVSLINDRVLQDPQVKEICRKHRVYHDGVSEAAGEKSKRNLKKMTAYPVYNNRVTIDYANDNKKHTFEKAAKIIYSWVRDKFNPVFGNIPKDLSSIDLKDNGYSVKVDYEEESIKIDTLHIDDDVAGRMWNTRARLYIDGDVIRLEVSTFLNDISEITDDERVNNFSGPSFYSRICNDDEIRVRDVQKFKDYAKIIKGDKNPEDALYELILNPNRFAPVVLIVYKSENGEDFDKSWLGNYWSSNLARWVRYYAHVYESDIRDASKLSGILEGETMLKEGVYLFFQMDEPGMVEYYSKEDIIGWRQVPGENGVTLSKSTEGCDAFMNDLVRKIKKNNIK